MSVDATAKTFLGMSEYGRVILPLSVKGDISFPKSDEVAKVSWRDFEVSLATVNVKGMGDVVYYGDSTYVRAEASINDCRVRN